MSDRRPSGPDCPRDVQPSRWVSWLTWVVSMLLVALALAVGVCGWMGALVDLQMAVAAGDVPAAEQLAAPASGEPACALEASPDHPAPPVDVTDADDVFGLLLTRDAGTDRTSSHPGDPAFRLGPLTAAPERRMPTRPPARA